MAEIMKKGEQLSKNRMHMISCFTEASLQHLSNPTSSQAILEPYTYHLPSSEKQDVIIRYPILLRLPSTILPPLPFSPYKYSHTMGALAQRN